VRGKMGFANVAKKGVVWIKMGFSDSLWEKSDPSSIEGPVIRSEGKEVTLRSWTEDDTCHTR